MPGQQLKADRGLTVYTDGSCSHIDRCGGWAWVAYDLFGNSSFNAGPEWDTTISRMELTGPAEALESLGSIYGACIVLLISDSEYVVKGINDPTRKRNKNVDCWVRLEEAIRGHALVVFEHTRGHALDSGNIEADRLAGEMRQAALHDAEAKT